MSKLTKEQIKEKMDELTPEGFQVKGGEFVDYVVTMDDGSIYSQAVARVLHANKEHAVRGETYNVEVKSISEMQMVIEGKQVPMAIVTVEIDSPVFGRKQNTMSALLDTSETKNEISAMHPIEKAVTQAIGRTLALYGFAFTGSLVSAEEIREGSQRQETLKEERKSDLLSTLKATAKGKGLNWELFLEEVGYSEEILQDNRPLVLKLLGEVRKRDAG